MLRFWRESGSGLLLRSSLAMKPVSFCESFSPEIVHLYKLVLLNPLCLTVVPDVVLFRIPMYAPADNRVRQCRSDDRSSLSIGFFADVSIFRIHGPRTPRVLGNRLISNFGDSTKVLLHSEAQRRAVTPRLRKIEGKEFSRC